jgi:hypothetical protein
LQVRVGRSCTVLASAAACAAVLAACGSAQGSGKARANTNSGVRFAACVRAHGVSDFPDPGGKFPSGLKQRPGFRAAMRTCLRLEPPGRSTGRQFTASQRLAALAQVRCIRDHGVPDFPDPTFPASGGELFPAASGFNPESPAFRRAARSCGLSGPIGQPRGG